MKKHPSWKIKNLKRAVSRARNFPHNTCGASRHVAIIADSFVDKKRDCPIEEMWEAEHMAESLYSVVVSLWELRTKAKKAGLI